MNLDPDPSLSQGLHKSLFTGNTNALFTNTKNEIVKKSDCADNIFRNSCNY